MRNTAVCFYIRWNIKSLALVLKASSPLDTARLFSTVV